jgi:hypothetical protein
MSLVVFLLFVFYGSFKSIGVNLSFTCYRFKLFLSSWFNYTGSCVSRNLSIFFILGLLQYMYEISSHMISWISLVSIVIFPFSCPILWIWVFYFLLLVNLTKILPILCIFQRTKFLFHCFVESFFWSPTH